MNKHFSKVVLCALSAALPLSFLAGCGGGGTTSPRQTLSLSGRNSDKLRISLVQQSASIAMSQTNRYTLSLKNDTSQVQNYLISEDSQGTSPATLTVSDPEGNEIYDFPDFEDTVLKSIELKPNQSVTRTVLVPASVFAKSGVYRVRAYFVNGTTSGDGQADVLGPLDISVR